MKAGVIDPAKVTRSALQNAASIAGLLLTTEALVADKPEKPNPAAAAAAAAAAGGGGMGGMGGMGASEPQLPELSTGPGLCARASSRLSGSGPSTALDWRAWIDRPPTRSKLLEAWMEWERGDLPTGPGHGHLQDRRSPRTCSRRWRLRRRRPPRGRGRRRRGRPAPASGTWTPVV